MARLEYLNFGGSMINLDFGKNIKQIDLIDKLTPIKRFNFRISGNSAALRDRVKYRTIWFLKYNKKAFSICWPIWISEGKSIVWFFGWIFLPEVKFETGKFQPTWLEIHFGPIVISFLRRKNIETKPNSTS